jgi:hypothetical protein
VLHDGRERGSQRGGWTSAEIALAARDLGRRRMRRHR